jgi:hypothetical protein
MPSASYANPNKLLTEKKIGKLKAKSRLLDAWIPTNSVMKLRGFVDQLRIDIYNFVEKKTPFNTYYLLYDAVTLLESHSGVF